MTGSRDTSGGEGEIPDYISRQPVHLHLRAQEGVFALYSTPLSLRPCVDIFQKHLQGRHLLLLTPVPMQWLQERALQAYPVASSFLLVPAQHMHHLPYQLFPRLTFADTPLLPEELHPLHLDSLVVDTFTSPLWHEVVDTVIGNLLYAEIRSDCGVHLICKERSLLTCALSQFLRAYASHHLPEVALPEDFPPLVLEQLWHYAVQGLAPLGVERTTHGVEIKVALGTSDPRACMTSPTCPHISQVQRGFILHWHGSEWGICSTQELDSARWQ
jgi:hypothetical protein